MTDKELSKYRRILGAKMEHLKMNRSINNDTCIYNYAINKDEEMHFKEAREKQGIKIHKLGITITDTTNRKHELFGTYEVSGMEYYLYEQKYQPLHLGEMYLFKGDDALIPDHIWNGICVQTVHHLNNLKQIDPAKFLFNIMKNRSNDFCISYPSMWKEN